MDVGVDPDTYNCTDYTSVLALIGATIVRMKTMRNLLYLVKSILTTKKVYFTGYKSLISFCLIRKCLQIDRHCRGCDTLTEFTLYSKLELVWFNISEKLSEGESPAGRSGKSGANVSIILFFIFFVDLKYYIEQSSKCVVINTLPKEDNKKNVALWRIEEAPVRGFFLLTWEITRQVRHELWWKLAAVKKCRN